MPKWTQTDVNSKAYGTVSFGTDTDQSVAVDPWQLDSNGVVRLAAVGSTSYDTVIQRSAAGTISVGGVPVGSGATAAGAGNTVTGTAAEAVLAAGLTLPAGSQAAGQVFHFVARGTVTTTVASQTVDLKLRLGGLTGTVLLDVGAETPNSGSTVTNNPWRIEFDVVFTAPTTADTAVWNSWNFGFTGSNGNTATVTNASNQQLVLTATNSATAVSITCTSFYCERVA